MKKLSLFITLLFLCLFIPSVLASFGQDLTVDGITVNLAGSVEYDNVFVINGGKIVISNFTGIINGSLNVSVNNKFVVDASSTIDGRGMGFSNSSGKSGPGNPLTVPEGNGGGAGGSYGEEGGSGGPGLAGAQVEGINGFYQ